MKNNKFLQLKSSSYLLIIVNIIPVIGTLFFNWGFTDILLIYWLETLVIGFFNILKILTVTLKNYQENPFLRAVIKIFFSSVFTIHFGAMSVLLGSSIYVITSVFTMNHPDVKKILLAAWPALLALFISHGYSFVKNYYKGGERNRATIKLLMIQPYIRLMGIFGILLIGAFAGAWFFLHYKNIKTVLVLFILLKILFDIFGHYLERKKFNMDEKISNGFDRIQNLGPNFIQFMIKKLLKLDKSG